MAVHIHEFLYRGRSEGSPEAPAWHLTLVSMGENDFGEPMRSERTLNMAQAEAAGWALPEIIAAINADVMIELDGKRQEIADLKGRLETERKTEAAEDSATVAMRRDIAAASDA